MKTNETYLARKSFRTVDQNDEPIELPAGELLLATSFDTLVSNVTGEVFRMPLHVARNPSWYFHRVGDMGHPSVGPKVTHEEYVREVVRGNEGLDSDSYWQLCSLEDFLPCEKAALNNSFTATLSKLGFEMRKDGVAVKGVGHNARNCTYHVPTKKKNADGLFAV